MDCLKCFSTKTKKHGILESGAQRYHCHNCEKTFTIGGRGTYFKTKYFILSKGTKNISKEEFKKHIRSDIERIKIGKLKVKELCDKYKVELKYNESMKFYIFRFINDEDYKTKGKEFEKKLETLLKQVKCEKGEIEHSKEIIETLNGYLD